VVFLDNTGIMHGYTQRVGFTLVGYRTRSGVAKQNSFILNNKLYTEELFKSRLPNFGNREWNDVA
jgi:hypothetical protein